MESIKEETESDNEIKIHEAEDTDDEDKNDDNDSNVIDRSVIKEEDIDQEEKYFVKYPNRVSNDVGEGKTIFLKNIPFSVKNDELKKCMEQFGPVYYALVCVDPLTEYSRGTAFVKFQVRVVHSINVDNFSLVVYFKSFNLVLFIIIRNILLCSVLKTPKIVCQLELNYVYVTK